MLSEHKLEVLKDSGGLRVAGPGGAESADNSRNA